jgi:hypothetical protein
MYNAKMKVDKNIVVIPSAKIPGDQVQGFTTGAGGQQHGAI